MAKRKVAKRKRRVSRGPTGFIVFSAGNAAQLAAAKCMGRGMRLRMTKRLPAGAAPQPLKEDEYVIHGSVPKLAQFKTVLEGLGMRAEMRVRYLPKAVLNKVGKSGLFSGGGVLGGGRLGGDKSEAPYNTVDAVNLLEEMGESPIPPEWKSLDMPAATKHDWILETGFKGRPKGEGSRAYSGSERKAKFLGKPRRFADLTKAELLREARSYGLSVNERMTKVQLRAALRKGR